MQGYVPRPLRVYLLDDHDIVRRGLRDLLSVNRDITVIGDSGSARQASRVIPELKPDLMLLDVRLQDGNGIQVSRAVRAVDPSIRALLVTSSGDDEALVSAMLAGAAGYVIKLAHSSDVIDGIRRVCAGRTLMHPAAVERMRTRVLADARRAKPPMARSELRLLEEMLAGHTDSEIAERDGTPLAEVQAAVATVVDRVTHPWTGPVSQPDDHAPGRHRRLFG